MEDWPKFIKRHLKEKADHHYQYLFIVQNDLITLTSQNQIFYDHIIKTKAKDPSSNAKIGEHGKKLHQYALIADC